MNLRVLRCWAACSAGLWVAATSYSADTAAKSSASPASSAQKGGRGTAKGPLPDPALLDGSAQKADKQSENGMLGEFEIPGDEDVRNGRVGGPEKSSPDSKDDASLPQNGGSAMGTRMEGAPGRLPKGAAGGAGPDGPQGAQGNIPPPPEGAIGGAAQAAGGDPNARPDGIQVGQLTGEAQGGAQGEMPQKPPPVAIGDSAMQIQGIQNAPNVVGGQVPAGQTQQMEKDIGGGGKGAAGNNSNRGAEKGRTMQPGL